MKILYLCITKAYNEIGNFKRKDVYDCTRKYWNLKSLSKAYEAEYIVGVSKGKITGIFIRTESWKLVKDMPEFQNDIELKENPEYKQRYAFTGKSVALDSEVGKEILKEYELNPFRFYGNVEHYNF